jgi:hypothetical protein
MTSVAADRVQNNLQW